MDAFCAGMLGMSIESPHASRTGPGERRGWEKGEKEGGGRERERGRRRSGIETPSIGSPRRREEKGTRGGRSLLVGGSRDSKYLFSFFFLFQLRALAVCRGIFSSVHGSTAGAVGGCCIANMAC